VSRFKLGLIVGALVGFYLIREWFCRTRDSAPPDSEGLEVRVEITSPAPVAEEDDQEDVVGYCVRCREKRTMIHAVPTTTSRGQPAFRGQCAVCGAGMFRMVGRSK
jgi:hypothetical protein